MNRARAILRHLEIEHEAVVGCGLFEFIAPFYKRHAIAFGNAVIVDIFELFGLFQTIQIEVIQRQAAIVVFAHQIERGACGNLGNAESRSEALREVGFARAQISHEQNHIAWLEDQLAKARASTGGSRELVNASISIRDRLVDYFRYVADGLPLERQAEANERAQALINALGLLANDLEAGRLADQCTRLHRNQLLGELDEARAALDASQGQVKQLEAEVAELRDLADRQAGLLSRTAVAIRGPEPDLARWSHHDLPELAAAMRKQRDICASAANKIQWATPDYSHQEGVCPECGQYEHDGHGEGCMVGRACGIYDVLRLTGVLK